MSLIQEQTTLRGRHQREPNRSDRANAARLDYDLIRSAIFHLQPAALSAFYIVQFV